ncbi:MAG: rRNA maturation RNase YbeY [Steroidobacteraceae bacterium]|nr:rRNA maturation RNase YbeY [Steroidobacteraceae bacterium]
MPHARSFAQWASAAFAAQRRPMGDAEIAIRVVGAGESRRLNRIWRAKDRPTNVLSFPAGPSPRGCGPAAKGGPVALGDLAICAPVVTREAHEQGKSLRSHWAHMVMHGVLHLLGYDHENDRDAAAMEAVETNLMRQFGYSDPYA